MGGTVGCHGGGMGNPSSDTPEHLHDMTTIKHFPRPRPMVNRCRWLQVSCEHALVVPAISGTHNYRVAKELALLRMYCVLCACSTSCTQQTQNSAPPPTYQYGASAAIAAWCSCKRGLRDTNTPLPINGKNYAFSLPLPLLRLGFKSRRGRFHCIFR